MTNHNGTEVFLDTNVLAAHTDLSTALGGNDLPGIQAALGALDTQLRTFKSVVEDADMEKAVTELVARQIAYQAAMLATSRVMSLNLADYLT